MVIFHSYVKLPEGNQTVLQWPTANHRGAVQDFALPETKVATPFFKGSIEW